MAVYTQLGAEDLKNLIAQYDVGELRSAKGIAEGVSNSNWLVETSEDRFILTMYEARTDISDLPFFLGLLDHLAQNGCPVPRTIHDNDGAAYRMVAGKPVALIEFLPGVSVERPDPAQARAVGAALASTHLAAQDFDMTRANAMGLAAWHSLFDDCSSEGLASIDPALPDFVARELAFLDDEWPQDLPRGPIHADLFPDNVLMLGSEVSGLIDFYFACNDFLAYDLAVTHAAWAFSADGSALNAQVAAALMQGYESIRPLGEAERNALPVLARGAAMRFLSTRCYDWLHRAEGALVTPKDPLAFLRRSQAYANLQNGAFPGQAVT